MNIHEYQSKQILKEFGVKVPNGSPAFSPEEAALARERGWIPVSLGDSRLRTETAAVVAATAIYFNYL